MITTTREEQYLAKYAGEDVPIPEPKTRTEMYLAKMAGMDVEPPAPITREEQILNKTATFTPLTKGVGGYWSWLLYGSFI